MKKKASNQQLSESSPAKDQNTTQAEEPSSITKSPVKDIETRPYSLQELGFLKEKLLVCCNIVRKRMKDVDDDLDKKKGIRCDSYTVGTILVEERSFLLRSPK